MSNNAFVLVISGPSGAGKGTICDALLKAMPTLVESISATTRKPRVNEIDGRSYFFISNDEFKNMITSNSLLEYSEHFGNYYGTPKQAVLDNINRGNDVLLEIEVNGAMQIKLNFPKSKLIFIMPPSLEELKNRLIARNTESEILITQRLARVEFEMNNTSKYDYIVLNDNVDRAVNEILDIIKEIKK